MIIVATIILIFALIIIGILVVPFHIYFNLYNEDFKIQGTFRLTWMKIRLIKRKIPLKKEEEKKEVEKKKFDINRIPNIISLLMESRPYFERILNAFLKSTFFEKFYFNLIVGLGDPVNTAMISGYLWALTSLVNIIPNAYVSVAPDFQKKRLDGNLVMEIKIRLLWIVIGSVRAYTKKPVRMLIKELREIRG